jgi:subtilisin family serine protease
MRRVRTRIAGLAAVGLLMLAAWPAFAWAYPDDPGYSQEHWLGTIYWPLSKVSPNVAYPTIAFVDSGMLDGFDEFDNYITPDSADCTGPGPTAVSATSGAMVDDVGSVPHGTQVASLAAAPINGVGIVGVSPFSPIVVVRVTRDDSLQPSRVRCALVWLANVASSGPLVVNLSMQFNALDGNGLKAALQTLVNDKALIIAATGNRSSGLASGVQWPAAFPHVMAVGDTERTSLLAGKQLDVLAPGTNLYLPQHDRTWQPVVPPNGGTSYSTALVSGAAALIWGAMPDVSNPQVVSYILRASGSYFPHWNSSIGFGTINLTKAFALALKPPPDDEFEPNDDVHHPFPWRKKVLHGIVGTTDDPVDYWKLSKVRSCVKRRAKNVSISCRKSGKGVIVAVKARRPLVKYTIKY